jgi:hypothetical protein
MLCLLDLFDRSNLATWINRVAEVIDVQSARDGIAATGG